MTPPRGFPTSEYKQRLARAQSLMAQADLSALLLTTEPEVRYFTGFLTRFWESPTRPWFLIIPATGDPIAVIPAIGSHLMQQSWISDIRTWNAPDLDDDGVSLLAETLREAIGTSGKVGTPSGHETHLRMPLADWQTLASELPTDTLTDDAGIMRQLRLIKSQAEIDKIRTACAVADRAFARVPEIAKVGAPLDEVFRQFQMLCLDEGADWVSYLAGAAGKGGYGDVISPATATPLQSGDVLMLDTGAVWDGYFCDFDRNFSLGPPSSEISGAHVQLIEATQAAFEAAKPGATAADLFHVMDKVITGGTNAPDVGRYGHGLGMQLTEWPSFIPTDHTILQPGMVLTLEPWVPVSDSKMMVHEENIVITETGAAFLSTPATRDITVLEG